MVLPTSTITQSGVGVLACACSLSALSYCPEGRNVSAKALPTKFDIHEWEIMREFSDSVVKRSLRDEALREVAEEWCEENNVPTE